MEEFITSGAITGAMDPNSKEADEHARMYYEEIRNINSDVERIANFLNKSREQILLVKKLFIY